MRARSVRSMAVFLERLALALGVGTVHALAAAHGLDGGLQALARQAVGAGQIADLGLAVGQRQQEQLAGDELVAALDGFLFGGLQQLGQLGADLHLLLALHLRQRLMAASPRQQAGHIDARALQQGFRAVVLAQHGRQQVDGLDVGVVVAQRKRSGRRQGFLELGGEFVESHDGPA
jgi:hypothetical protein